MKQSRRIDSNRFAVKTGKNGKPVIVDLHDNTRIVCGFNCFVVAYAYCNRLNRS